jgi:L-ascorbate metabolism protein UlaG (beta-lactamase superfamily)
VLFVPVGGGETIGPAEASNVIAQIEPRVVVPIHYATSQLSFEYELAPLDNFTHEMGLKEIVTEEKLSVTSSNLPPEGQQARVVVLRPVHE